MEESPTFDTLQDRHGAGLAAFLQDKVEVVEGDASQPGLGLDAETQARLQQSVDLIANSAGLTDFNPDLRDALSSNVDSANNILEFLRHCDHAGLIHLSTCYVVGMRDGRVGEELRENYNPANHPDFDAEREIASLREMVKRVEERAESAELEKALRRQALGRSGDPNKVGGRRARRRAEKKPGALGAQPSRARGDEARSTLGLAEYLHVHEEPRRIVAGAAWPRSGHCHCAALDRGEFHAHAVHRME